MQYPIRLDQYLQLTGAADSGGMAKMMIADGLVQVNGELETRRGRKLQSGDLVLFDGEPLAAPPPSAPESD